MMPISDYFAGIPLCFKTGLAPETLAKRINSSSKSVLNPLALRITGYARFGRIVLKNRSFPYYNGQPCLTARFELDGQGSIIRGTFGAAPWLKVFFVIYFLFLSLLSFVWIASYFGGSQNDEFFSVFGWMPLAFWIAPFGFHFIFTMSWEDDLRAIVTFLESEADSHLAWPE